MDITELVQRSMEAALILGLLACLSTVAAGLLLLEESDLLELGIGAFLVLWVPVFLYYRSTYLKGKGKTIVLTASGCVQNLVELVLGIWAFASFTVTAGQVAVIASDRIAGASWYDLPDMNTDAFQLGVVGFIVWIPCVVLYERFYGRLRPSSED